MSHPSLDNRSSKARSTHPFVTLPYPNELFSIILCWRKLYTIELSMPTSRQLETTTYLAILHALPRHERDEKHGERGDPSKDDQTDGKYLEGRARHDKGHYSHRARGRCGRWRCLWKRVERDAPGNVNGVVGYVRQS